VDHASNFPAAFTLLLNVFRVFRTPQGQSPLDALGLPLKFESDLFWRLAGA
jgi:hypothetical protein